MWALLAVALSASTYYASIGLGEFRPAAWIAPIPVLLAAFRDRRARPARSRRAVSALAPAQAIACVVLGYGVVRLQTPPQQPDVRVGLAATGQGIFQRLKRTAQPWRWPWRTPTRIASRVWPRRARR